MFVSFYSWFLTCHCVYKQYVVSFSTPGAVDLSCIVLEIMAGKTGLYNLLPSMGSKVHPAIVASS